MDVVPLGSGHSPRSAQLVLAKLCELVGGLKLTLQNMPSSAFFPCCDLLFNSAEECAHLWSRYNVVQVSAGPLHGHLRVDHQNVMLLVAMQADQALLVEGTRHPRWLSFTLEHTDNYSDHRHFGESLSPNALAGFNTKMKETLMKTSPGVNRIGAFLVYRSRIYAWVELMVSSEISDQMEHNNTAILSPVAHRKLR